MITDAQIKKAKRHYNWLMIKWFSLSVFGIVSTLVIWQFIFKNILHVKGNYIFMNNTKDGDYGATWWLEEKGLTPGILSAIRWWFRNHSWNYIRKHLPEWNGGQVDKDKYGNDEFLVIQLTIPKEQMYDDAGRYNRFTKANTSKNIYGINYYAYKINDKVFFNYSKANSLMEIQRGAGGNEFRWWLKFNIINYFKSNKKYKH